jgi:hypothetical protein
MSRPFAWVDSRSKRASVRWLVGRVRASVRGHADVPTRAVRSRRVRSRPFVRADVPMCLGDVPFVRGVGVRQPV